MLEFILGIAVGAAFSPFWMKVYYFGKDKIVAFMNTPTKPGDDK